MLAPAPGRFSITTCWPQTSDSRAPMVRAMMSVAPPGTNGTIRRTKRVGHAWANVARTPRLETRAEAADEPSKQRRLIMAFLPAGFLRAIEESLATALHGDKRDVGSGRRSAENGGAHPPRGLRLLEAARRCRGSALRLEQAEAGRTRSRHARQPASRQGPQRVQHLGNDRLEHHGWPLEVVGPSGQECQQHP